MRAAAAVSIQVDAYRAGLELADALRAAQPEVVLIFSCMQYDHAELLNGIHDGIDNNNLIVIGNTGDGCYGPHGSEDIGASALGLNSEGRVRWQAVMESGLREHPRITAQRCISRLQEAGASLAIFGMDFRCDASEVLAGIQTATTIPVVGGAAGDYYRMRQCRQFYGRRVLEDSMVAIGMIGDAPFQIRVAHALHAVGHPGSIDSIDGCVIHSISGQPALAWIAEQVGRPYLELDMGVTCLRVVDANGDTQLRSLMPSSDKQTGAVRLYGHIDAGSQVHCCIATCKELEASIAALGADLHTPAAVLVISCAGRKRLLGPRINQEVRTLTQDKGDIPIAGYPSFGEFGPLPLPGGGYSRTLFHNMTYILLAFES